MQSTTILSIALISCIFMLSVSADPAIVYFDGDTGVSHFPVFQGLKMHIRCYTNPNSSMATGPVALLDAGLPFSSLIFANLLLEIIPNFNTMNISRACVFDRYGYGWSDAAPYPFMSTEFVYRFHNSLQIASIPAPYVYIGWSWGSIDAQNFALNYMADVAGVLTIDGTDSGYAFDPANPSILAGATSTLEQCLQLLPGGVLQSLGEFSIGLGYIPTNPLGATFPVQAQTASNTFFYSDKFLNTAIQEVQIMIPSASLLNQTYIASGTTKPLSNIPLVVLTADSNGADWINRQSVLASLSTRSVHLHDAVSSHFIPVQNPAGIVNALKTLLVYVNEHIPVIVI